ncbi:hypothetical protein [Paraburkholderia acidisoli]|uniref:Preprotein translocase subunit SecA n=1 Tax=Paraburkholderia acidisoli TaxID=2571748 RepID=A0A7Z2GPG0_9BURK|nr:hypothetical protein [Paraburkholderia acidisoli]QGZ65533.1 hypothetical protein FAZ98_27700 [Paraburkholderia acidisoli]
MLSPHELATLMLVRAAPEQIDMTRVELDALLDSKLIALDGAPARAERSGAWRRLVLTPAGLRLLDAAARLDAAHSREPHA